MEGSDEVEEEKEQEREEAAGLRRRSAVRNGGGGDGRRSGAGGEEPLQKDRIALGLEVCTTLGMLDQEQAEQLAEAGVYAYNHNLDTSPEFYKDIITTRTYEDRLQTLENVRNAGMTVCCGGIVGMGEEEGDRIGLLQQLSQLNPHPESVPVNLLVKVEGTPLADEEDIDIFEMVRMIATACIIMPESRVRLSAGRKQMSDEAQALCFLAGASSIFSGEKLLTTANPGVNKDEALFAKLGLKATSNSCKSSDIRSEGVDLEIGLQ